MGDIVNEYSDPMQTPHDGYVRLGIRSHGKGTFYNYVKPGQELGTAQMHKVATDKLIVNITFAWEHAVAITDENDAEKLVSHRFPQFSLSEKICPKFLHYLILDGRFRHHLWLSSPGGAGRNRVLKIPEMLEYKMQIPSVDEQRQIAYTLCRLDNLITLHQRKYDNLVNVKKAMLEKMFPKDGADVPEIRFKGFTEAWEQRKLGELSSSFEYGLNAASKEFDGKNKYIRITDIDDDSHDFNQKDITSPDIDLSNADNFKLREGDILFARTGASVGKTYIYKSSHGLVYYAGFLIRARIKEEYNPEFVFQNTLTNGYQKFIKVTSMRSGQPGINALEYYQFELMVPEKAEQSKIGKYFRQLDNLITLHQRKLLNLV